MKFSISDFAPSARTSSNDLQKDSLRGRWSNHVHTARSAIVRGASRWKPKSRELAGWRGDVRGQSLEAIKGSEARVDTRPQLSPIRRVDQNPPNRKSSDFDWGANRNPSRIPCRRLSRISRSEEPTFTSRFFAFKSIAAFAFSSFVQS